MRKSNRKAPATFIFRDEVGLTKQLADVITESNHFARDPGGKLYHFSGGVYQPKGETRVKALVKRLLEASGNAAKWTVHRASEVLEYIRIDAPELWSRPPLDIVNVRNGLLCTSDRELHPHTPQHLSTVQLPVQYDASADCPAWKKFIEEVFPRDALALPWEVAAWLMIPYTSIQKAVLLLGEGANGKSTFLEALTRFIGKPNVTNLSLHRLESDRFSVARLVGRLANICPDLPSAHLAGTSVFKALTGGDVMTGERKFVDSFEFEPFARLVFSANQPPRSEDNSAGFFRRWLVVPFTRTFDETNGKVVPRAVLDARLSDPAELSGVLNQALAYLPEVLRRGVGETASMRNAWGEFRTSTDPLAVWLDLNTVAHPAATVAKNVSRQSRNVPFPAK